MVTPQNKFWGIIPHILMWGDNEKVRRLSYEYKSQDTAAASKNNERIGFGVGRRRGREGVD